MRRRRFGKTERELPVIGQGTWNLPEHRRGRADAIAAIRRGVELGMTHIDTAEMYGAGEVERVVGEAIAPLDRSAIFLVSKVLPSNASYEGTLAAARRSLERLGTPYLDGYLLHWCGAYPIEETMRAMRTLIESGLIRFAGASNCDVEDLEIARRSLAPYPLLCDQVLYHLHERTAEHRLVPYARANDVPIVGYTPFGRRTIEASLADATLREIAAARGTTVRSIVLAFLTRDPMLFTIPKASSVAHVEENALASEIVLRDDEIDAIDRAFPRGPLGDLATI